jgi:large subunit ribosomal protein L15
LGKTAGRGEKGQGKRSAGSARPARFEGGQMPLVRRLPKRGFHSPNRREFQIVNLAALSAFGDSASVDVEALISRGLIRRGSAPVKLLGEGEAPRKLTIRVHRVSAGARQRVEAAGGSIEILPLPRRRKRSAQADSRAGSESGGDR